MGSDRHLGLNPGSRGIQKLLCEALGRSRQAYHRGRRARSRKKVDEGLVMSLVATVRAVQPRLGGRKLLHVLRPEFERAGVSVGRDRFFRMLAANGLLVEPRRALTPHTTRFDANLPVSRNWVAGLVVTGPWQALVADITYIRTVSGFVYLTLVTDKFTREVVGWRLSDSLKASGCVKALAMAARRAPRGCVAIVHSDRGCQFAGKEFRAELKRLGWVSSMTEERHCYENSVAERVNGILKQEFLLDTAFAGVDDARREIAGAIRVYNNVRPHLSLGMMTPYAAMVDPWAALPHVRHAEAEAKKVHERRMAKARAAREAGRKVA